MKLVTFQVETPIGKFARVGALHKKSIVDLNMAYTRMLADKGEPQPYRLAAAGVPARDRDRGREHDHAGNEIEDFRHACNARQHAAGCGRQRRKHHYEKQRARHRQPTSRLRSSLEVLPTWATR